MKNEFLEYSSTYWKIKYPADWPVEKHDDTISFVADNGVGALQISAYLKDGKVTDDDLKELIEDEIPPDSKPVTFELEDFRGLAAEFRFAGHFWRMWLLTKEKLLLYITYNCEFTDREVERELADKMINSLKWQNQE